MSVRGLVLLAVGFIHLFVLQPAFADDANDPSSTQIEAPSCPVLFERQDSPEKKLRRDAFYAGSRFQNYFNHLRSMVMERDYLFDVAEVALLAREHLLMMGPPGNAKSQFSDLILGNILERKAGVLEGPSYYRIQMTPETTQSETHGPLDFKVLSDTGRYERIYGEGMLLSRNVFIDEIFDARANATRNILGLLAERAHAQGPRIIKGKIESVFAASNRYVSQVYDRAGDDSPKAVIDRFAFGAFVPGAFEYVDHSMQLLQGKQNALATQIPEFTFEELDQLRALIPQVQVPDRVAKFVILLFARLKAETESLEQASLKDYQTKLRNGEQPAPPYRSTKYYSPRTKGKAGVVLRAFVVQDWIRKGGKRKLEANFEDVQKLEKFFTLNGANDRFTEEELARTWNPHEKAQLMAIMQEREIFHRLYDTILAEVNAVTVPYALVDMHTELQVLRTPEEKQTYGEKLIEKLMVLRAAEPTHRRTVDLRAEDIGHHVVQDFLTDSLKRLLGPSYETHINLVLQAAEQAKQEEAARIQQEKAEALRVQREAELAERRRQQEAARQAALQREKDEKLISSLTSPDAWQVQFELRGDRDDLFSFASDYSFVAFFSPEDNNLRILDLKTGAARETISLPNTVSGSQLISIDRHFYVLVDGEGETAHSIQIDENGTVKTEELLLSRSEAAVLPSPDRHFLLAFDVVNPVYYQIDVRTGARTTHRFHPAVLLKHSGTLHEYTRSRHTHLSYSEDKKNILMTGPDFGHLMSLHIETSQLSDWGPLDEKAEMEHSPQPEAPTLMGLQTRDSRVMVVTWPAGSLAPQIIKGEGPGNLYDGNVAYVGNSYFLAGYDDVNQEFRLGLFKLGEAPVKDPPLLASDLPVHTIFQIGDQGYLYLTLDSGQLIYRMVRPHTPN